MFNQNSPHSSAEKFSDNASNATRPEATYSSSKRVIKSHLLPIRVSADIDIQLHGLLANVVISQTFTNTTDKSVEAIHSIPVPVESSLVRFTVYKKVHENEQAWQGRVLPRTQAEQQYETCLDEGDSAFQLKQSSDDVLTLFLGNLLSKETIRFELELVFPVQWYTGKGQLYLPLVMGERYGKSTLLLEETPHDSFLAEYPLSLTLGSAPGENNRLENYKIHSPSHPLKQQYDRYSLQEERFLDRDLIVYFECDAEIAPTFNLIALDQLGDLETINKQKEPKPAGLLTLITDNVETETVSQPRDILFLLDCSGSMSGTPMTQLKKVMRSLLKQMRPQDRFNLYPFGSTTSSIFTDSQPVTEQSLLQAQRYIRRNLEANLGGTETIRALLTALMNYPVESSSASEIEQPIDLVLITDGDVWLDDDSIEMRLLNTYAQQHNIRIFTIGVGHATTEKTVKKLAEMSGGSYLLTNPNEDIHFQVEAQFKRLFKQPLTVRIKTDHVWHSMPHAYQGDAIQVPICFSGTDTDTEKETDTAADKQANSAGLPKLPPSILEVEVTANNRTKTYQIPAQLSQNAALANWIASQRYQSLPESEKERYAVEHQLLTNKTNYLVELLREDGEKTDEIPTLVQVPQMQVYETGSNYLNIPTFSRREMDQPMTIGNGGVGYRLNSPYATQDLQLTEGEQHKQERADIQALAMYLLHTLERQESTQCIEQLMPFELPQTVVDFLRLLELQGVLLNSLPALIEIAQNSDNWSSLIEQIETMSRLED